MELTQHEKLSEEALWEELIKDFIEANLSVDFVRKRAFMKLGRKPKNGNNKVVGPSADTSKAKMVWPVSEKEPVGPEQGQTDTPAGSVEGGS